MKELSIALMLLFWGILTIFLTITILGIVLADDNNWFDIPDKLIAKL